MVTLKTGSALVQQGAQAVSEVGKVATNVSSQLQKFTDPTELAKSAFPSLPTTGSLAGAMGAAAAQSLMKGGGIGIEDSGLLGITSAGFLLTAILLGGAYFAAKRLNISVSSLNTTKHDDIPNDTKN